MEDLEVEEDEEGEGESFQAGKNGGKNALANSDEGGDNAGGGHHRE